MKRMQMGAAALAFGLLCGVGAATAQADRVVIEPPRVFIPEGEFVRDGGYYRTHDGHYYHYDKDRNGWHYGRNHDEGVRYERDHRDRH